MTKIKPSDDAIAITAASMAQSLVKMRIHFLRDADFGAQEKYLMNYYRWAVKELINERNA